MTKPASRNSNAEAPSPRLTDAQRDLLTRAASRPDGAIGVPEGKGARASRKLAATLIERGLLRETRAKPGMPVWRRDDEGRAFALIVTRRGRAAVGAPAGGRSEVAASATPAPASPAVSAGSERSPPRQGSKLAEVIALLGRRKGAGVEELVVSTGWLPHTLRAALTGLRKRGFTIERSRTEQGTAYRIIASATPALAA